MRRETGILFFGVILLIAANLSNSLAGNPVSRWLIQRETVKYYTETYQEAFTVYAGIYNFKIPGYVFEIGPVTNPDIRFSTALYSMEISDVYGGELASRILIQDVSNLISMDFEGVDFQISAQEDPLRSYFGQETDYFETDPENRILMNHFVLSIQWIDPDLTAGESALITDDIIERIENSKLQYMRNLDVRIQIYSPGDHGNSRILIRSPPLYRLKRLVRHQA
jgi:hypothetical protein